MSSATPKKAFPVNVRDYCPVCDEQRDFLRESVPQKITARGVVLSIPMVLDTCTVCRQARYDEQEEARVVQEAFNTIRRQKGLLTSEEIKDIRSKYHLSQKAFAVLLGMSEATVNRYENGALQDDAHNALILACRNPDFVRQQIASRGHLLGARQRTEAERALNCPDPEHAGLDWVPRVDDRTGYRAFDYERYVASVLFLCRRVRNAGRTMINKLLFYADFLHYKEQAVSLTGSAYRRLDLGPAPENYGELEDRLQREGYVKVQEMPCGPYMAYLYGEGPRAKEMLPEEILGPGELRVLEHVAKELRGYTAKALSERSHREGAWLETPDRDLISYHKAKSLSLSMPAK
jgi:putative zinc finger/helix-turn-helix YgiT family protein